MAAPDPEEIDQEARTLIAFFGDTALIEAREIADGAAEDGNPDEVAFYYLVIERIRQIQAGST